MRSVWFLLLVLATGSPLGVADLRDQTEASRQQAPVSGLESALQAALGNHPAIKGKSSEIESSRQAIASARAERYPSLSAQANSFDDDSTQSTLRLQVPVWSFGKIDTRIKQARANLESERLSLVQVQRLLIEDTAVAYARIEGVRKRRQVADSNVAEHMQLHQQIQRRQQGGMASETDVGLAYSRLLQARSGLQRLNGEMQIALSDLYALTLEAVPVGDDVDASMARLPPMAHIKQMALDNNADLRHKQARVEVVALDVREERVASLPTIFLRAEHNLNDVATVPDRNRVGLVLEANLDGFGFATSSRIRGAASRLDAARYDVSVTRHDLESRVERLVMSRQVQSVLLASQQEMVAAIKGTVASFVRQYDTGRKSWLDVLNTQRELSELQAQMEQIRNDGLVLSLQISALIGHLDHLAGMDDPW